MCRRNLKVNPEGDGDLEANSWKETGDGGTRKQKCHRKCPKLTTPVSETPFLIFIVYNTAAVTVQHVGEENVESWCSWEAKVPQEIPQVHYTCK